ncbi:retrovirus-related Pol polyprotein from transposon 412 [Trichonephila clavipes]|nr:retrovirus-related Pol polyprotein from transposon 412 [Trichonephila clavipes]
MTGNQLDVIIDRKPIRALVDSGASFSVISDKYRQFLKKVLFADAKSVMLKVADGNFVRPIGKCVLRVRINNRELPFEFIVLSHCSHDIILGWDFLEASQAVIDCGQNELVLEDICRVSTAPNAWNLYATRDYTLKPHSLTRITVSGYQTRGDINVVLDGSKHLLFEKNIATPSMVSTYRNGKSDVWVTNLQFRNQIIPRGMCIGQAEPLNEGHLCVISDTSEKQAIRTTPKFSGLFTKTDKSTAAKTNVKHRIFTGDHAPINQRAYRVSPTERRIIHEEVQKMLDEGIVQPSESPWSSPVVLEAGLKLNSKKCLFAAQEVKILGHLVSSNGVRLDPDKIKARWKHFSLKKALTSDPVLGMYDERASTEIHTDASGYGIGAVLVQIQNNVEKVIAYASRTLTKAEKNYSTTERECLAIVWATNKFRPYIFGKHFTVVTDHHSLCWLMNLKDPSGRLARWASDFKSMILTKNFDPDGKLWLPVIPKYLQADILRHFHDAPTAGHLGFAKTYDRIRKRFYWPGMYRNVVRYVMHCRECQRRKSVPQRPPGRLVPIPPAIAPFHRIGIDLLGRFPKSAHGNKWIIVCADYSTRYAITKALPTAEVAEIAKFLLEEIVLRHGAPRVIITDRGAVFRSRLVSSLVDLCNIDHRFTTAYHPQTNGLTERFNKTLADMLSMYVDVEQKNWDEILPFVTFAYNTAKQETTGFTPFYLLHGHEAETTLDTMLPFCPNDFDDNNITKIAARAEESRQLARVHTLRAQDKDRRRYDSKHQMVSYAPGDLVWVYTPVLRRLSAVTYAVQDFDPASRKRKLREVVHVLRMKPYHDPAEQIETEDIPPKESYKGPITRSRIKTLEQNDSGRCLLFRGEQCRTHNLLQVPIAELAERWTELSQVSGGVAIYRVEAQPVSGCGNSPSFLPIGKDTPTT